MDTQGFAQRLKFKRLERDLSQKQLADAAGVSDKVVGFWETGSGIPRGKNLEAIAKVLGVSMSWLLQGEGPVSRRMPDWMEQLLDILEEVPSCEDLLILKFGEALDVIARKRPVEFKQLVSVRPRLARHVEPVVMGEDSERERPTEPVAK